MSRRPLLVLLLGLFLNAPALQAQPASAPACPSPFSTMAPPDNARIGGIREAARWPNAYVLVDADGFQRPFFGRGVAVHARHRQAALSSNVEER